MNPNELRELFCKEKRFLNNVSESTIIFYREAWKAFLRVMPCPD
jgi:hypothetical protein